MVEQKNLSSSEKSYFYKHPHNIVENFLQGYLVFYKNGASH